MTTRPATDSRADPPAAQVDPARAAELRAAMVSELDAAGVFPNARWREAFEAVPRHVLVPEHMQRGELIQAGNDEWLSAVYSDDTLITQRGDGGAVTSSGTMPSLIAAMLAALDVHEGDQVLQIATGTGYTAALLCARLGSDQVTSIEIDPELTALARTRLRTCGYAPDLVVGDGREGCPQRAPYDRLIATLGLPRVPVAWTEQVRPGGVIVAPVVTGLARLTVTAPGHAAGPFIGSGYFIGHRGPTPATMVRPLPLADQPTRPARRSAVLSAAYYDTDFRFYLDLSCPGLGHAFREDPHNLTVIAPDSSHAHITPDGAVTETGARQVWADIEHAHHEWDTLGRPGRQSYRLALTPRRQWVTLTSGDAECAWNLT
jgi:protein-L-isoaspartate(D-aspartate) O-methyltransferase